MGGIKRRARSLTWALALCAATAGVGVARAAPAETAKAPVGGVFGLAVTDLHYATYVTPDAKECPQGFNATQRQNYLKMFPNNTARAANEVKYGYGYGNRGPNGENVLYNPELGVDPIPYKLVQGSTGLGVNLDGKVGPNDYTSPDGQTGIDNQLYRVLGCSEAFRGSAGYFHNAANDQVRALQVNRLMFEVSGVDDLQNDPDVIVRTYRGVDPIVVGVGDKPTAGITQHIDYARGRRYMTETHGRIVNGLLTTDPIDLRLPWVRNAANCCEVAYASEYTIRGMRLQVKLTPGGGEGYIAGYADLTTWWSWFTRSWAAGAVIEVLSISPPSLWHALHEQADGYPDKSGANTAISMALSTNFVRIMIAHDDESGPATHIASNETHEAAR